MNSIIVAAKGMAWGALFLAAMFSSYIGYRVTAGATNNFMSATDFAKVVSVYERAKPRFQKLNKLMSEGHKMEFSFGQYEDLSEIQKAYVNLLDEHNKIYCQPEAGRETPYRKCSLYGKSTDYTGGYSGADSFKFSWKVAEGERILEGLAREENYKKFNTAILVSAIAGGVIVLLSLYAICALILYARIGALGLAIVVAAVGPIYAVMLSFSYSTIDENFHYVLMRDDLALAFMFGMLYVFLVYPSVFLWLKSKRISVIDIILLRRI